MCLFYLPTTVPTVLLVHGWHHRALLGERQCGERQHQDVSRTLRQLRRAAGSGGKSEAATASAGFTSEGAAFAFRYPVRPRLGASPKSQTDHPRSCDHPRSPRSGVPFHATIALNKSSSVNRMERRGPVGNRLGKMAFPARWRVPAKIGLTRNLKHPQGLMRDYTFRKAAGRVGAARALAYRRSLRIYRANANSKGDRKCLNETQW